MSRLLRNDLDDFEVPADHIETIAAGVLRPGVLIEIGARGGALPQRRLAVQSLMVEHAEAVGVLINFDETTLVSILVFDRLRTLVEDSVTVRHAGKVLHSCAADLTGSTAAVAAEIDALADWISERAESPPLMQGDPRAVGVSR